MTDLELLELAAKAARIKKDDSPCNGGGFGNDGFDCAGNMMLDWHNNKRWNPLTDDGDALRLAVKLGMVIDTAYNGGAIAGNASISCDYDQPEYGYQEGMGNPDPYAATRRAIVRAAAEIGKTMR